MGGKTSQSSQTIQIPPEVLARYNAVNARAEGVSNRAFQQYSNDPNAFVQGLSETQKSGIGNINAASGIANPYFQQAGQYAQGAGQAINAQDLQTQQFMSPYLQNVLGSTEAMLNQQNQQAMAGQTGNAIRQGAFGGDRAGIAAANLAQQQNLAAGKIYSDIANQGYSQALNAAMQNAQSNRAAQLAASQNMANLGLGAQQAALQGAQAQLGAGQLEQQTGQAGKTALYNQFMQEQSYPFQVAQFLANIAEGTGALSGSTTYTQQPGGFFSDERLKEDIHEIGKTFDGQPIYKYRYKGDPKTQIGLMAQDVEHKHPHAVGLAAGYKTVDYDKATKEAEHKGHFASGGLAGESMGGHVTPEHMGEGFAYGGSPVLSGLSSSDMAALLEAQAKMFGPYSEYGLDVSGSPHGGVKGYIPQANLPVSNLAVASGGLSPQESGLEQSANAAKAVSDLYSTYKTGKEIYDKNKTPTTTTTTTTSTPEYETDLDPTTAKRGGLIGYADGGSPDGSEEDKNKVEPLQQPQQEPMPTGAAKAPNEGQTKLDIPTEQKAIQPLVAQGASAKDPTMDQMKDLASMAASIAAIAAKKGGYIEHRNGLAGGGIPYSNDDGKNNQPTLNIPTGEGQAAPKLQTAGGLQQGPSGLQNLGSLAGLGASAVGIDKALTAAPAAAAAPAATTAGLAGTEAAGAGAAGAAGSAGAMGAMGAAAPWLLGGLALGSLFKNKGGSVRHGYALDGGVDDSNYYDMYDGVHNTAEFPRTENLTPRQQAYRQFRDPQINKGLTFSMPKSSASASGSPWPDVDESGHPIPTQTTRGTGDFLMNEYVDPSGQPTRSFVETKPLTEEQKAIDKTLTFATPKGGRAVLNPQGGLSPVPSTYNPATSPLPRTVASTHRASRPVTATDAGMSDAEFQATVNKLGAGDQGLAGKQVTSQDESNLFNTLNPSDNEPSRFGEDYIEPSIYPAKTEGLGAASAVTPTTAPEKGLVPAAKPAVKQAAAATTEDGKPAHWYTDPKYIIPLLQGVAAMGVTPTRSLGVALASGMGQGLKGYQEQRQFELDKQQQQAQTRGIDISNAIRAAQAVGKNKFTINGVENVILDNNTYMPSWQWNLLPVNQRPTLWGTAMAAGTKNLEGVPVSTVPRSTDVSGSMPAAPQVGAAPSDEAFNRISSTLQANQSSVAQEAAARRTANAKDQLNANANIAVSQEPQIAAMANAVSSLGNNSLLQGNTFADFFRSILLNYNKFLDSIGHSDARISEDLTQDAIRNKFNMQRSLGAGSASVQALETALSASPSSTMTRDAAIAITAGLLIDKQRPIDERNYELNTFNRLRGNNVGYDAENTRNEFSREYGKQYAADKNALIALMNAVDKNTGRPMLEEFLHQEISPEELDRWMKVPGISRYFITSNR